MNEDERESLGLSQKESGVFVVDYRVISSLVLVAVLLLHWRKIRCKDHFLWCGILNRWHWFCH
jgi:hypothetical protein